MRPLFGEPSMNALKRAEPIATIVLTICAVVLTAGYVKREYFTPAASDQTGLTKRLSNAQAFAAGNMTIGRTDAPIQIVEFSDFECPACRRLYRAIKTTQAKDSGALHITFRNYPLDDLHPSARAAGIAAQCAADQGVFEGMHDYLFDHQSTLGTLKWNAVAAEVGVPDSMRFRICLDAPATRAKLSADSAAAAQLEVTGTPLVILDGYLIRGAPKAALLDSMVGARRAKPM